jgi:hypothetical protein
VADDFRWAPVTKDPEEIRRVALVLFALCVPFWEANEQYDVGDFAWPIVEDEDGKVSGNGYVNECTRAGRSGSKQPIWSLTPDVAMSKLDGSVEWTPRIANTQGISPVVAPIATPEPGISVEAVSVSENMELFVDYSGGTVDQDYEVKFTFFIAGLPRIGRQTVQVRLK